MGCRKSDLTRTCHEPPLLTPIRPERDERSEEEYQPRKPDEVDERLDEDAKVDASIRIDLLGDHEEILTRQLVTPYSDLVRHLLLDCVGVFSGLERPQVVTAAADAQRREGRSTDSQASTDEAS